MIKKIRFRFVLLTMSLLTLVFGVILIMNTAYKTHVYRQIVTQYLEFIADGSDPKDDGSNVHISKDFSTEIYLADFDKNGNIVKLSTISGKNVYDESLEAAANRIFAKHSSAGKIKSYIYFVKNNENGKTVVLANSHSRKRQAGEIASLIAFITAVMGLLLLVSVYLSRFVTDQATKALEREKQFISDASHELKTPISAIILNAQAMPENDNTRKHLKNILSEAERMNKLIRRLLTLACIDETEGNIKKNKFCLSESCEEMVLPFESLAFESKINFTYDIAENIYYRGVCEDIKQVVSILLDNAFKYTPENGEIRFTLAKKNHRPVITVYNTGEGISQESLPRIFDRFYCSDKSRKSRSGSFGLGLSIAKAIIDAHDSELIASSEQGKYAQFTVYF